MEKAVFHDRLENEFESLAVEKIFVNIPYKFKSSRETYIPNREVIFCVFYFVAQRHGFVCTAYGISENFNVSDCFNISIEVIKYIALGIGLFIVLTGGGVTIKVIFIIALILFIVILAILFVFGFAFQGLLMICNCGMAAAEFVIAIIYTNLKDIIGYLKNKYPNASSVAIKDKKKLSKQAAKKLGIKDRLESNPNLYVGKGLLLGNNNEIVGEEEVIFDSSVPIEVGETYTL